MRYIEESRSKSLKLISTFALLAGLIWLFFAMGCSSTPTAEKTEAGPASWSEGMSALAGSLQDLAPYFYSRKEYQNPQNRNQIKGFLDRFAAQSALISTHMGEDIVGHDPLLKYALAGLKSNVYHARSAFIDGYYEVSRNFLRASTNYCFHCHSTQNLGPQRQFLKPQLPTQFVLSPTEKADYQVATRNFDGAIQTLSEFILEGKKSKLTYENQEDIYALKKYLLLQLRVKNNPGEATSLLVNASTQPTTPTFLKSVFREWIQSLSDWNTRTSSDQRSVSSAKMLMERARKNEFMNAESGFIDYVLATKVLHEELLVAKRPQHKAEVYELLAESYSKLNDTDSGDLPDNYWEACIRTHSKSSIAKRCYKEFERSLVLNYANSSGVGYFDEDRALLRELKSLAGL